MNFRLTLLLLILATQFSLAFAESPDHSDYQSGKAAFEAKNYEVAREHFELAEKKGGTSPELDYSLGTTYYRLGEYEKARERFLKLKPLSKWSDEATYMLGLIEQKAGEYETAERYFFEAMAAPYSVHIRQLASDSLGAMQRYEQNSRQLYKYVFVSAGFDDNVIRADDTEAVESSNEEDVYLDVYASIGSLFSGSARQGERWSLGLYSRTHADLDEFDFAMLSTEVSHHRPLFGWQASVALNPQVLFLDGQYFSTNASLYLQLTRNSGDWRYRVKEEITNISSDDDFDYLDGWRNRTRFEARHKTDSKLWQFYYEWEYNDRDDQIVSPLFRSHSPERHTLSAAYTRNIGNDYEIEFTQRYRDTRYKDRNIENINNALQTLRREEERLTSSVRLNRLLGKTSKLYLKYRYLDNDSNLARSRYESNEATLGIEAFL